MSGKLLQKKYILFFVTLFLLLCFLICEFRLHRINTDEDEEVLSIICMKGKSSQQINGFYEGENLYFFIPAYTDFQNIKFKMKESCQLKVGETVFQDGDLLSGIEKDQVYDATYMKNGEENRSFQVMFMQGSALPTIDIHTASGSLEYIHSQKGNSESGFIQIYDSEGNLVTVQNMKSIKGRGNTAWDAVKKSYMIHLDDAADILGMGADKEWVLNANWYDGSYIRNQIGFEVAKAVGMEYVSDTCFVELYINDEYAGLYQLMESVKTGRNRIDIDSNNYLLEIDYKYRAYEEENYIMLSNEQPIVIQFPKKEVDSAGVQQFFDEFSYRMEQGDIPFEQMDLDSFATMFVMEDLLQDLDFGYSSHYMILDLENSILREGPVWDLDNTMGRGTATEPEELFVIHYDLNYNNLGRWYARLYNDDRFRMKVAEKYQQKFRPILEELIHGGIEKRSKAIEASVKMDLKRFPETRSIFMSSATFEENIEYLIDYLKAKLEMMDAYYEEDSEYNGTELPSLEIKEEDVEVISDEPQGNEERKGIDFLMQYKMLFLLLVIWMIGMVLYGRCRRIGKW